MRGRGSKKTDRQDIQRGKEISHRKREAREKEGEGGRYEDENRQAGYFVKGGNIVNTGFSIKSSISQLFCFSERTPGISREDALYDRSSTFPLLQNVF